MATLTTRGQSRQLLEPVTNHNSYKQSMTNHETISVILTSDVFISATSDQSQDSLMYSHCRRIHTKLQTISDQSRDSLRHTHCRRIHKELELSLDRKSTISSKTKSLNLDIVYILALSNYTLSQSVITKVHGVQERAANEDN